MKMPSPGSAGSRPSVTPAACAASSSALTAAEDGFLHQDRLALEMEAAPFDLRDVEHLVDQLQQVATRRDDVGHALVLAVAQVHDLQKLAETEDGVERGAQLVAHAREEGVLRLVGALGVLLGGAQLFLRAPGLGDVVDLRDEVAPLLPGGIAHHGHVQADPDEVAALVNVAFFQGIGFDLPGDQTGDEVQVRGEVRGVGDGLEIAGEEFRLGVADDLAKGLVDAQPAAIPRHDGQPERAALERAAEAGLAFLQFAGGGGEELRLVGVLARHDLHGGTGLQQHCFGQPDVDPLTARQRSQREAHQQQTGRQGRVNELRVTQLRVLEGEVGLLQVAGALQQLDLAGVTLGVVAGLGLGSLAAAALAPDDLQVFRQLAGVVEDGAVVALRLGGLDGFLVDADQEVRVAESFGEGERAVEALESVVEPSQPTQPGRAQVGDVGGAPPGSRSGYRAPPRRPGSGRRRPGRRTRWRPVRD